MTCEECGELMIDALYGEEVKTGDLRGFFGHLDECPECKREYLELAGTREQLASWDISEETSEFTTVSRAAWSRNSPLEWWPPLQKVAAGFLILFGLFSILQRSGVIPGERGVSEGQIRELVHDLVVVREDQTLRLIGNALLDIKEEMENRNRLAVDGVYDDLYVLEQRYLEALEENNRQISTLLNR